MRFLNANLAGTTLATSVTAVETTMVLAAGTGAKFPSPGDREYFVGTVSIPSLTTKEIVHVTSRVNDTLTVLRAQEGTVAAAWNAGAQFEQLVTAGQLQGLVQFADLYPTSVMNFEAKGDAVLNAEGGWDGTDDSVAFRDAFLFGKLRNEKVGIPRGKKFIISEQIIAQGEMFSGGGFFAYGEGDKALIILKTREKAATFRVFNAGGTLQQDGIFAVPCDELYDGDGIKVNFEIAFTFENAKDLVVYVNNVRQAMGEDEDYIIVGGEGGNGNCIFNVPPPPGVQNVKITQALIQISQPTYYFTDNVKHGETIAPVNTVVGLTNGWWVQIADRGNALRQWRGQSPFQGGGSGARYGQPSKIISTTDGITPTDFNIMSGTYDNSNGLTEVWVEDDTNFAEGTIIQVSELTGTGTIGPLNGDWSSRGSPGQKIITFFGPPGLAPPELNNPIVITGGKLVYDPTYGGNIGLPRVVFSPAFEFDYTGPPTEQDITVVHNGITTVYEDTKPNAVCLRRFGRLLEDVSFEGLSFTYDKTAPPKSFSTHTIFDMMYTVSPKVVDVEFDGSFRCINISGAVKGKIDSCDFTGGNRETYYIVMSNGTAYGSLINSSSQHGRHLTMGTSEGTSICSCHMLISGNISIGHYWTPFASHAGVRKWLITKNLIDGSVREQAGDGIQLRGTDMESNSNEITACTFGIEIANGTTCKSIKDMIRNCWTGIDILRGPGHQVIGTEIINSIDQHFHIQIQGYLVGTGYFPGLHIEAKVQGSPINGDIAWITTSPNQPFVLPDDYVINIEAQDMFVINTPQKRRAPVITIWSEGDEPIQGTGQWATEVTHGVNLKTAAFTIPPMREAFFLADSTTNPVPFTFPPAGTVQGQEITLKKINTGGNPVTAVSEVNIEGAPSPYTIPDMKSVTFKCYHRLNPGLLTYVAGWWIKGTS